MAPNKRKILEAARKYAQKGQKDRALKEYERLLKLDPRDAKLRLEIGDAYRRWGQVEEAITAYTKVADQYMSEGFDARAVAVFKQIQNLDPNRYTSYLPLAELYQRMGLTSEAIQALQTAADGMHRQGQKREALELLRKMASLDPTNTASRIKVGDLLRQEGMKDEALHEYEAACAELERQGADEPAEAALGRVLDIDPGHVSALTQLARNLLRRGFAERAEPFARRALEAEADEPDHFELLADVYRAQQRDAELTDTYKRLADLYRRRGDEDRAREITQRFVPPDEFGAPLDASTLGGDPEPLVHDRDLLGDDRELLGEESTLLDDGFLDEEVEVARQERPVTSQLTEETVIELAPDRPAAKSTSSTRPIEQEIDLDEPEGEPDQLLAEASVYLRYGKRAQAVRNLDAILVREPGHRGALEKLGEAHADAGDAGAAVEAWLRAAERAREEGDRDGLVVLRDRIAALDEEAAASLGIGPAEPESDFEEIVDLETDSDLDLSGDPSDGLDDDIEIEIEGFDDEPAAPRAQAPAKPRAEAPAKPRAGADPAPARAPAAAPTAPRDAGASLSASQQIGEDLEEAEFYRQQGLFDEAAAIYERVLELAPNHPLALVRMGEIAAARGDDPAAGAAGASTPPVADAQPEAPDTDSEVGRDLADWTGDGEDDDSISIEVDLDEDDLSEPGAGTTDPELDESVMAGIQADLDEPLIGASESDSEASALGETGPDELSVDAGEFDLALDDDATDEEKASDPGDTTGVDIEVEGGDTPVAVSGLDEGDLAIGLADEPEPDAAADDLGALAEEVEHEGTGATSGAGAEESDGGLFAPAAAEAPRPGFVSADAAGDSFDLAAELSEALDDDDGASTGSLGSGAESDVFAAVFSEFKKGVSATLGEGDQEAHYDLGIAYREMGLLDDALGEFRQAMSKPARRVDCLHMLGLCLVDLGRPAEAVEQFQQALGTRDATDEQRLAVNFELGGAYERLGQLEKARGAWESVIAVDPSFCAVEERIANLGQARPAAQDGDYESFGDLFDDAEHEDAADQGAGAQQDASDGGFESFEDLGDDLDDDDLAAPEPEADADDSPEPEPEPEPDPEPEPTPRRRRKKISFV